MIYLIKIIFFLLISYSAISKENNISQVLFKISNKFFTNVDLEKRKEYVKIINNFTSAEFNKSENEEITNDYISSLVFHEYYIQNKINYKDLNSEINLKFKKMFDGDNLNDEEIENFKFNLRIDLIRNKIIEEILNSKKNSLLQEANKLDLLYNYNVEYLIIKEDLIDKELLKNINDRNKFNNLKNFLRDNKIEFFYKEEDINDNDIISNKIKNIIKNKISVYKNIEGSYVTLISINKNLESYEGIFVKLISFNSTKPYEKKDILCKNINKKIDINKTVFKEYEYSKLNDKIKNNLKSIDDYIILNNNGNYNYIVLCDLTYDENLLKNINFNKKVNVLVEKIQNNFLKIHKDEYQFIKVK